MVVNDKSYDATVIRVKGRSTSQEKIVLSPDEIYEEDIVVKIRLLIGCCEEHVLGSTFSIDGQQLTNFKETDSYDMQTSFL